MLIFILCGGSDRVNREMYIVIGSDAEDVSIIHHVLVISTDMPF